MVLFGCFILYLPHLTWTYISFDPDELHSGEPEWDGMKEQDAIYPRRQTKLFDKTGNKSAINAPKAPVGTKMKYSFLLYFRAETLIILYPFHSVGRSICPTIHHEVTALKETPESLNRRLCFGFIVDNPILQRSLMWVCL